MLSIRSNTLNKYYIFIDKLSYSTKKLRVLAFMYELKCSCFSLIFYTLTFRKPIWLTVLVTAATIVFVEFSTVRPAINEVEPHTLPLPLRLIILIALVTTLYNSTKIIRYISLELGPDMRWLRTFLSIEAVSITLLLNMAFNLVYIPYADWIISICAVLATITVFIGYARQRRFENKLNKRATKPRLLKEKDLGEVFKVKGQETAINRLNNLLATENDPTSPLTIFINGKWGDGKTHIANQALENLELENSYIILRFEPWRHVSEESIITNFYSSLGQKLSELPGSSGLQFDMAALSRTFVSKLDKTGTVASLLTQYPWNSPQSSHKKAEDLLKDTSKRLLVIIDDVERCPDKNRILRTLQLGFQLGNDIKNSTTIILGDIQEMIRSTDISETYLQKVVDEQIDVLPPTRDELLAITTTLMQKIGLDINIEEDGRLDALSRNIRGVKRILTSLSKDHEGIKNHIHPQDLFTMNVLKHAYPTLYSDITQNRQFYVPFTFANYTDEEFKLYAGVRNEPEFIKAQVEHFKTIIEQLSLDTSPKKRLVSIIEELFPATKHRFAGNLDPNHDPNSKLQRRERRIGANRNYLDRYFLINEDIDRRHAIEDSQNAVREEYFTDTNNVTRLEKLSALLQTDDINSKQLFFSGLMDMLAETHDATKSKILAHDALRLYFQTTNYLSYAEEQILESIVDTINTFVNSEDYDFVFKDIDKHMLHPSTGLELLLMINPNRDNNFYDLKQYSGYDNLRKKILKKTDQFYIGGKADAIDEDDSQHENWRFIIAQWSTSVCLDDSQKLDIKRFNRVNKYLMTIAADSHEKFHTLLMVAFWDKGFRSKKGTFRFDITPQPYDADRFATRARKILKQKINDTSIKNDLENFVEEFRLYKESNKTT